MGRLERLLPAALQRHLPLLLALSGFLLLTTGSVGLWFALKTSTLVSALNAGSALLAAVLLLTAAHAARQRAGAQARLDGRRSTMHRQGRALLTAGGVFIEGDSDFATLLTIEPHQLPGRALRELVPESIWLELLKRSQRTRPGSAPIEHQAQPVTVGDRSLRCHFNELVGTEGDRYWLLTLIDCTEEERLARALSSSQDDHWHQLEAAADWVLELSPEGGILKRSAWVAEQLGATVSSLDACLDRGARQFRNALRAVAKTGEPLRLAQLRLRLPESNASTVDLNVSLQRLDGGKGSNVRVLFCGVDQSRLLRERLRLKERYDHYAGIFAASTKALALIRNADHTLVDCNPAFRTLLGYGSDDEQKLIASDLWIDEQARDKALAQLEDTSTLTQLRSRFRRADGSEALLEVDLNCIDLNGEACTLCVAHDVEDQLQQERALRTSEEKFLRMFHGSPDAIAIIRVSDGLIRDVNPATAKLLSQPRNALVGRSCFDSTVNPIQRNPRKLFAQLEENQTYENVELEMKTRQGHSVPTLVSATTIIIEDQLHLLLNIRDLTEFKAVRSRLRRIEDRFRGAFENAQLALLLVDMEGRIFQTNAYARDLLAFTDAQFDGLHISRLLPTEDRNRLKIALGELQARGQGCIRSERRLICQNGLELWTNFQIVLQQSDNREEAYFIIQATDITDIKVTQRRMERMAFYDTLTDLANRRLFTDRLRQAVEHCQRRGSTAALLYLDLDQFKRVNDTLGHEAGDALLREVAQRLAGSVRNEDTVARMGGDEFTVLLYDVQHSGDAGVVAGKILTALTEPLKLSGHDLIVSASIGVAVIPDDGTDPTALLKNADLAMYRAKERGRNNYQFYSEDMNAKAHRLLAVEQELRRALERQEFVLYHQPKVSLADGTLVGVECLVRWQHPERGLISPGEFIDVAEETGAIVPLGTWIIEAAVKAAKAYSELSKRRFVTAVNISPRQFRDPKLVNTIRRCLRTYELAPEQLQIEITETMLMQDVAAAELTVNRLHELGIQLAIDDFGTGYSSLNYLKRFPIHTVKVDRSFVKDIPGNSDDCEITAAVIAMAHRLQMSVVAEGVETQAQLEFLRSQDCEYGQGYLFSKPISEDAMRLSIQRDNLRDAPKVLVKA